MKRFVLALLLVFVGCKGGTVEEPATARLKLVRQGADRVAVEINNAPASVRAVQLVLKIDGGTFTFDDAKAPSGLPLDTVEVRGAGSNRAVLFAGDKRGVGLPAFGAVATFRLLGDGTEGRLAIEEATVADIDGRSVEVDTSATLTVR